MLSTPCYRSIAFIEHYSIILAHYLSHWCTIRHPGHGAYLQPTQPHQSGAMTYSKEQASPGLTPATSKVERRQKARS